jgi:hypothetical protein
MGKYTAEQMNALAARSGNRNTTDPLVSFLYVLLRDHVPAGVVEVLVMEASKTDVNCADTLSNGWLALYAEDVVERLRKRAL